MLSQTNFSLGDDPIMISTNGNTGNNHVVVGAKPGNLHQSSSFGNANMLSANGYESLISKIQRRIANKQQWFSLEFFPPKTVNGAANLISK